MSEDLNFRSSEQAQKLYNLMHGIAESDPVVEETEEKKPQTELDKLLEQESARLVMNASSPSFMPRTPAEIVQTNPYRIPLPEPVIEATKPELKLKTISPRFKKLIQITAERARNPVLLRDLDSLIKYNSPSSKFYIYAGSLDQNPTLSGALFQSLDSVQRDLEIALAAIREAREIAIFEGD